MKNNPNLCYILSFKMIGQFVEFKEYHINKQATYSLTEKIMHLIDCTVYLWSLKNIIKYTCLHTD